MIYLIDGITLSSDTQFRAKVELPAPKDSFLRALREVAPEMELFLENHGQYTKSFVTESIYI